MAASRRDHLVKTAMALFERNGFHATGIDRILVESGVAKMTLYKHFRSKDDLVVGALEARDAEFRAWLAARVEEAGKAPRKRLTAFFAAIEEWVGGPDFRGCPFILAAGEYPDPQHPVHLAAAAHKEAIQDMLKSLITDAGLKNGKKLARMSYLLLEGAIVAALVSDKRTFVKHARAFAEDAFGV